MMAGLVDKEMVEGLRLPGDRKRGGVIIRERDGGNSELLRTNPRECLA